MLLLIGISGVPSDVQLWAAWIDHIMTNPTVQKLADQAAIIAGLVNDPTFRLILILIGIVILAWPLKLFWRLRYRIRRTKRLGRAAATSCH